MKFPKASQNRQGNEIKSLPSTPLIVVIVEHVGLGQKSAEIRGKLFKEPTMSRATRVERP